MISKRRDCERKAARLLAQLRRHRLGESLTECAARRMQKLSGAAQRPQHA